jgi:hypothetical protein
MSHEENYKGMFTTTLTVQYALVHVPKMGSYANSCLKWIVQIPLVQDRVLRTATF